MAGNLKWYGDRVLRVVSEATDEALTRLAFQIEAKAKVKAHVDTGFMRNSIYTLSRTASTYGPGDSKRKGQFAAPPASLGSARALVGVAANYAIYEELKHPFLFPAAEEVIFGEGQGIIEATYREKLG